MSVDAGAQAQTDNAGSNQDAGAPVLDYGEILAQHQHELARSGKTVEALRGELGKTHETMDRVRKAFTGETEQQLTPSQMRMRELDDLSAYLDSAAEENRARGGSGLPATSKIGKQLAAFGKEAEARADRLEAELAEMKAQLKRSQNPAYQGLERAAFVMEGMVDDALTSMYGADAGAREIKAAQFNAVTARINAEIKDLMKNDPDALLKVQRNPKIMRSMVNHFMAEMLPPKVRQQMDEQWIRDEPMDVRDLYQAFSEAREALEEASSKNDAKRADYFSGLMTSIRQEILGHQYGGKRGGNDAKPSLNKLLHHGR